jgi:hypothetical protein
MQFIYLNMNCFGAVKKCYAIGCIIEVFPDISSGIFLEARGERKSRSVEASDRQKAKKTKVRIV